MVCHTGVPKPAATPERCRTASGCKRCWEAGLGGFIEARLSQIVYLFGVSSKVDGMRADGSGEATVLKPPLGTTSFHQTSLPH